MKNEYINQSTIKIKKNKNIIIAADFETVIHNNKHLPILIGWKKELSKTINIGVNHLKYENKDKLEEISNMILKDFIIEMLNLGKKCNYIIYFHNLGSFDGVFILNIINKFSNIKDFLKTECIIRNNKIYEIKIKNIIFRDSLNLIPLSLEKTAEILLSNDHSKIKIDYEFFSKFENIIKNKKELIKYLERDIDILYEILVIYRDNILKSYNIDITETMTISGLAFKIYRTNYIKNEQIYKSVDKILYKKLRMSYYGGLTNVFKPKSTKCYYYDVNSLYPYSMLNDMPISKPKQIKKEDLDTINIENFFGFIECEIYIPESLYIPPLPYREKIDLILPTGYITGTWFSEEIKNAVKNYDCKIIKIFDCIEFERGKIFDDFVNHFYKKKSEKNNESLFYKLILNSLYGRFGMKNTIKKSKFIKKSDYYIYKLVYTINEKYDFEPINDSKFVDIEYPNEKIDINKIYKLNLIKEIKKRVIYEVKKINNELNNLNIAVQISSAITAYSRIKIINDLNFLIKNNYNIYYSDTDSIVCDKKLPGEWISKNIGSYKLEGEYDEGIFIAPKIYILKNNLEEKITFKGLPESEKEKININNISSFKDKTFDNIIKFFKKDVKNLTISKDTTEFTPSYISNKREKVYDENNNWIDTKPINKK